MRFVFKSGVLITAFIFLCSCSKPTMYQPGVYELSENSYITYDETIVSGTEVTNILNRFYEILPVIVVKGEENYVFGNTSGNIELSGVSIVASLKDKEEVINQIGTYESYLMKNSNNEVIGIRLTERSKSNQ